MNEMPYLKSYSSLRIGSKASSASLSSATSTNCHQKKQRGTGVAGNRRGSSDSKSGNQRSESMINFSKRLSILTGKEVLFPAADEDEREDERSGGEGMMQSNQSPHRQDHSSTSSSVIRIRDRMPNPSGRDQGTDGSVQYRHHQEFGPAGSSSHNACSNNGSGAGMREARIAPPLRVSHLWFLWIED